MNPINAIVSNSYPFIQIETGSSETANKFRDIITLQFKELTVTESTSGNATLLTGTFSDECSKIGDKYRPTFKNLTFNTNKG